MIIDKYFRGVRIPMLLLFVLPAIFMFFLYQQFNPMNQTSADDEGKLLKDIHIIQVMIVDEHFYYYYNYYVLFSFFCFHQAEGFANVEIQFDGRLLRERLGQDTGEKVFVSF